MGSAIHCGPAIPCSISHVCECPRTHWHRGGVFSLSATQGSKTQTTPTRAVPVTCPRVLQSAPGTCRLAIQTAARRPQESVPASPGDCCGLGMEHRIVGPGPYRATRLVSDRRAELTPHSRYRGDSGCAQSLGVASVCGVAALTLPLSGQMRPVTCPTKVA